MPWINFRSIRLEIRGIKSLKNRQIWKRARLGNSLLLSFGLANQNFDKPRALSFAGSSVGADLFLRNLLNFCSNSANILKEVRVRNRY
jgi:hypothetical protein